MRGFSDSAADPVEVVAWFKSQPDLAVHVIAFANALYEDWDCSSIDDVVEELEFWNVGQLGFIPIALIENLGGRRLGEEMIWSAHSYETNREWVVYKVWWFIISIFKDSEGILRWPRLFPDWQHEKAMRDASQQVSRDEAETSNIVFSPVSNFLDIDDQIQSRINTGSLISRKRGAFLGQGTHAPTVQLLRLNDGTFILVTTHFEQYSKYRFVESVSEGFEVMEKFW
jgi:hypothetical protein